MSTKTKPITQASPGRHAKSSFCPACGHRDHHHDIGGGFLERGEFDGKAYEDERDLNGSACTACGHQWFDEA